MPGLNRRSVVEPVLESVSTAFNVNPLITVRKWPFKIVMSLLSVTPSNVPPLLVDTSDEPSANATVPPTTAPPFKFHEPVVALTTRSVLVSVPVRLTVPPVRLIVPMSSWVKVPSRFSVELFTVTVPSLSQSSSRVSVESVAEIAPVLVHVALLSVSVAPLMASAVPLLVNPLVLIVRACPETSAVSVPLLISELDELWEMLPRPCTSMSVSIVSVMAPPKPISKRLAEEVPAMTTSPVPPRV